MQATTELLDEDGVQTSGGLVPWSAAVLAATANGRAHLLTAPRGEVHALGSTTTPPNEPGEVASRVNAAVLKRGSGAHLVLSGRARLEPSGWLVAEWVFDLVGWVACAGGSALLAGGVALALAGPWVALLVGAGAGLLGASIYWLTEGAFLALLARTTEVEQRAILRVTLGGFDLEAGPVRAHGRWDRVTVRRVRRGKELEITTYKPSCVARFRPKRAELTTVLEAFIRSQQKLSPGG